jgi:mono/diheme cytochrome c family protein
MDRLLRGCGIAVTLFSLESFAASQPDRGQYLATQVAMCVQCHSPRDAEGRLIEQELFLGAPIPVAVKGKNWALRAPRIAGLTGWTAEDFIRLLQTGKRPDGSSPRRPMPPFRMTREDAAAIEAYLRSLGTARSAK